MDRVVIALLFVFAVVIQSASPGVAQDGIRPQPGTAQPSMLPEYANYDDPDHNFFFTATIFVATAALKQLAQLALPQRLRQTRYADRDQVPLYELHAVWRI